MVRGIQEDRRRRRGTDMGRYHLSLAAGLSALSPSCSFLVGPRMSLYINSSTDFPNIARSPRHSWSRAIYSPQRAIHYSWTGFCPRFQVPCHISRHLDSSNADILPVYSLTLEASLREVTSLRQQILRIKGENSVSCLRPPHLSETH